MIEPGAIFLSASVPVTGRRGFDHFDPVLINSAVHAFVEVVLGRRLIVWGGQPAITHMIWEAAKGLGVSYDRSVLLYQSAFFKDRYPEMNVRFPNWIEVPAVEGNKDASLKKLRQRMFEGRPFEAAVFIGGMEGVDDEYELLTSTNPPPRLIPLPAAGGVAGELFERIDGLPPEMRMRTDFTYWLYRLLAIDPSEPRVLTGS